MEKRKTKGITLIALIITIIVLLILAGVSIATLTGENGILTRAREATEKTEQATTFEGVTIPAGFAPTKIEGESTVDEGLVIIDSEGNEFVWVPVPNMDDFNLIEGYRDYDDDDVAELQTLDVYGEVNATGVNTSKYNIVESETTQKEAIAMYKSVEKNEGFYIGRYEAGNDGEGNVVVRKGADVYNNIKWGNSMTDDTGGAVEKARRFKEGKIWENSAISTLIYGVQWDATMQFFDNKYKDKNCETNSYVRDSTGRGWYKDNYESGNLNHKTGIDLSNGKNKIKNIYDMAGNVLEWTMGTAEGNKRQHRGGVFIEWASRRPASSRGQDQPETGNIYIGFRVALYIK